MENWSPNSLEFAAEIEIILTLRFESFIAETIDT